MWATSSSTPPRRSSRRRSAPATSSSRPATCSRRPASLLIPGRIGQRIAGIANVDFKHAFNTSTSLTNKLTAEYTSENTFLQNELSLQVKMNDQLAIALGYAVRYNTDPPPSFAKTDTLTTVNLVYEVK